LKAVVSRLEKAVEELTPSGTAKDVRRCFCVDCKCDPCNCLNTSGSVSRESPAAASSRREHSGRQVLFFTADWCPDCPKAKAAIQPLIEAGKIQVVDCSEDSSKAEKWGVGTLPCLLQVVDGQWKRKAKGVNNISLSTGQSFLSEAPQAQPTIPNGQPTIRVQSPVVPAGRGQFVQPLRFQPSPPVYSPSGQQMFPSCPGGNCRFPQLRSSAMTQERRDLLAHLSDTHGQSLGSLQAMSTAQLRALHNRCHGGPAVVARGYAIAVGL